MYYRIRNKERLLHPCEQEQIAAIFLKHGIKTKPEFDRYIDKYDWQIAVPVCSDKGLFSP